MTTFIQIEISGSENPAEHVFNTYYLRNDKEIAEAQAALRESGLESEKVYVGDPNGDSQANGQILFAK